MMAILPFHNYLPCAKINSKNDDKKSKGCCDLDRHLAHAVNGKPHALEFKKCSTIQHVPAIEGLESGSAAMQT